MSKVAAICFVLLFTLATGVWVSARASGHSMTFLAASTPAPCLALHTSWSATLYNLAGPTAPPQGLFLMRVTYDR